MLSVQSDTAVATGPRLRARNVKVAALPRAGKTAGGGLETATQIVMIIGLVPRCGSWGQNDLNYPPEQLTALAGSSTLGCGLRLRSRVVRRA